MKKYAFIAIVALLSLSVTSTVAFADNDNDQVNQLKNILQQLQEKINGLTPSGIIKKIEKMEEKAFKLLPSGFPERIKIGKSGMNIEELGNGQIKVNLKNAVVTEIDLVNNVLTIKIFGLTGKIKITTDTKTQREYRDQSNINEFAVGDYVNAYGTQDPNNPTTINAEIVRNVSITKKDVEKRVCIQVLTQALNPETNVCKTFPTPCAVPKGWSACPTTTVSVLLGQQFTLKKGQVAKIADTGLEIEITAFYNSPCPAGVQCVWSGVGIGFEYRFNGQVQKGINLVQAFGYRTTIAKTDHETYANLVVDKIATSTTATTTTQ